MEIIDSSKMTVLSEFDYVDEIFNGTEHYAIGVLNENVLVRITSETGWQAATFLYERTNHLELIERIEDVYAGKLPELNIEYFTIKKSKDFLVIKINETFPHTSFKPIVQFRLTNNRRVELDGDESGVWNLYMSVETGKLMLAEMKRIKDEVVNQNM